MSQRSSFKIVPAVGGFVDRAEKRVAVKRLGRSHLREFSAEIAHGGGERRQGQVSDPIVQAFNKWVFRPAQLNNQPVAVKVLLGIPL